MCFRPASAESKSEFKADVCPKCGEEVTPIMSKCRSCGAELSPATLDGPKAAVAPKGVAAPPKAPTAPKAPGA
ncbi:MAG: zinc-ribbon domain-containing protein [Coriobacteriia bacterium]